MSYRLAVLFAVLAACQPEPPAAPAPAAPPATEPAPETFDYSQGQRPPPVVYPFVGDAPLDPVDGEVLIEFGVQKMDCEGCAKTVYDQLVEVPGVKRIRISLAGQRAWVSSAAAQPPTVAQLRAALAAESFRLIEQPPR